MVWTSFLIVSLSLVAVQGHAKLSPTLQLGETCIPGQKYREDCNTCECTSNYTLICTKMHCLNQREIQKLLHLKRLPQRSGGDPDEQPQSNCTPGKIYKMTDKKCFCENTMTLMCITSKESSRSKSTTDIIPKFADEKFENLPALPFSSSKCKAGITYRVLCNICLCLDSGNTLCEMKMCYSINDVNNITASLRNGKPCKSEDKSNFECVDCKCVNDVLKCEPIDGCFPLSLRRQLHGSKASRRLQYNASNRGSRQKFKKKKALTEDLADSSEDSDPINDSKNNDLSIRDPIRVNSSEVKCIGGKNYIYECNHCSCFNSRLACTNKFCPNFASENIDAKDTGKIKSKKKITTYKQEESVQGYNENELRNDPAYPLRSILHLDHENEKCIPGLKYQVECNNCYCQPDFTLRCTLKRCLNYVQSELLNQKRKEYEAKINGTKSFKLKRA